MQTTTDRWLVNDTTKDIATAALAESLKALRQGARELHAAGDDAFDAGQGSRGRACRKEAVRYEKRASEIEAELRFRGEL